MKKLILLLCMVFFLQTPCSARDFIVEFIEENYKETQSSFSYFPVIYHSLQVQSKAGPKMLILKGDDYHYRRWLRQYIAQGKQFIAKVPDDQNDLFIKSSAFEIDVTLVHPFNLDMYHKGEEKAGTSRLLQNSSDAHMDSSDQGTRQDTGQKRSGEQASKVRQIEEKKRREDLRQKKEQQEKNQAKQAEQNRIEQEKQLKELQERQAAEELRQQLEFEKKKKEQDAFLAAVIEQRKVEEDRRRQELEQRWLELRARLLEDERIRNLELEDRKREIERRWLELKTRYGF